MGGNYTSPSKIENGDPFHVFRWFFIDTYARLTALHLFPSSPLAQEQANADIVADAYCEASVVLAEQNPNDSAAHQLVTWLVDRQWIRTHPVFHPNLVARAQQIAKSGTTSS